MRKGKGKEKEGDNEARAGKRETEPVSNDNEHWTKDLALRLKEGEAKSQGHKGGSENAKAESSTMDEDQIALVHALCCDNVPFKDLKQLLGVPEGAVGLSELVEVVIDAEKLKAEKLNTQEIPGQTRFQASDEKFEVYDPDRWEAPAEENNVDETSDDEEAPVPEPFDYIEEWVSDRPKPAPSVLTSGPRFVRALKDSKGGSKPYFRSGDILRVISKVRRKGLNDQSFDLLPLKPPGEAGRVLIRDFEPADQGAVDAVGREASTEKEKDSFRCAMEWED